jgi:hypothetical protein
MADDGRSIQELFSTAFSQVGRLLRSEVQLARAEISANLSSAVGALALVAAGFAVAIAALALLLMALSAWLQQAGMSEPGADFLSGLVGAAVGAGLSWAGISKLRSEPIAPNKTLEQVGEDAAAIKDQLK